jgi:hypothetical protein
MTRPLLLAALAFTLAAGPLAPRAHAQEDLGRTLAALASLWERGDAAALAAYTANLGLDLEVHGEALGRMSGRKLVAALRHLFSNQETASVRARMTSRVTGTDETAFGELTWDVRPRGSAVTTRSTVFLGLVREPAGWRVTQIRVLR